MLMIHFFVIWNIFSEKLTTLSIKTFRLELYGEGVKIAIEGLKNEFMQHLYRDKIICL